MFGPGLVFLSLSALWKNEVRFDYHQAAAATRPVAVAAALEEGQRFSFTGPMNQGLFMSGEYVVGFTGYLLVDRQAEIYAWSESKDSDNNVTWKLRWMSRLEDNSRNAGVRQLLSSRRFMPDSYQVGELKMDVNLIEFVASSQGIPPASLERRRPDLSPRGDHFYLYKEQHNDLGNERLSYQGLPVPQVATVFSRFANGLAIADTSQQRDGWINRMIQDSGVLHHLVAGDRETALASLKRDIGRVKMFVRALGTLFTLVGFLIFFYTIFGALLSIPWIGRLAEAGVLVLSLAIGLPLAILTMVGAWFVANPLVLVGIIAASLVGSLLLGKRSQQTRDAVRRTMERQRGDSLDDADLRELEFLELAALALGDGELGDQEDKFLRRWAKRQGWDETRFDGLMQQAREQQSVGGQKTTEQHLRNLVQLALADGQLTSGELATIERVARRLGYSRKRIIELARSVQQRALAREAQHA